MVRIRTRIARRKYMRKRVYSYEIYYLEFPRKYQDYIRHFSGKDLKIDLDFTGKRLTITLEALQDVFPLKNAPAKDTNT